MATLSIRVTFMVKIDQQTLKFLLEYRIRATIQQNQVAKLTEYNFVIHYEKGKDNLVVNAQVEIKDKTDDMLAMISFPSLEWIEELKATYNLLHELRKITNELSTREKSTESYKLQ